MKNLKMFHQFQILKEHHRVGLNRVLIVLAILSFVFAAYIANYKTTEAQAWERFVNILRFDYLILLVALRSEVKILIGKIGYRIIVYLLINHFIDRYLGYNGWSWNDFLTIIITVIDIIIQKINMKKYANDNTRQHSSII